MNRLLLVERQPNDPASGKKPAQLLRQHGVINPDLLAEDAIRIDEDLRVNKKRAHLREKTPRSPL
jgi:hypothetical protein